MNRVALVIALGLSLACSSDKAPQPGTGAEPNSEAPPREPERREPEPNSLAPEDGFFMAEGAPDPRACSVATDCLGDTIPDLANPCCQNPRTLEPYARAYKNWLNCWRSEHCEAVTCPPPPAPSRPPDCAFEVACADGVCVDACP